MRIYTLKEIILLGIGRGLNKILAVINYNEKYRPLKGEIDSLKRKGFIFRRYTKSLLTISNKQLYNGIIFFIRPYTSDIVVFNQVIVSLEYIKIIDYVKKIKCNKRLNILDIGSNVGFTSIYLINLFNSSKIVSVEADYDNYLVQKILLKNNNINNKITLLHKALWWNDIDELTISDKFRDGDSWAKSVILNDIGEIDNRKVSGITLSILKKDFFGPEDVDILKIDIEGAEAIIFAKDETLKEALMHIKIIAIEIHDEFNCRCEIKKYLINANFLVEDIGETTFCINRKYVI